MLSSGDFAPNVIKKQSRSAISEVQGVAQKSSLSGVQIATMKMLSVSMVEVAEYDRSALRVNG